MMRAVAEVVVGAGGGPGLGAGGGASASAARARWTPRRARSARSTSPAGATSRSSPGCGRWSVSCPVVLVGDGVAMTAAEHWQGAARGHANALCMVVSTGVGGGLVLNGRLHPGPTGNAGHIGHISVDLDGDPCPCGGPRLRRTDRQRPQHRPPGAGERLAARRRRRHQRRRGRRLGARRRPRRPPLLRAGRAGAGRRDRRHRDAGRDRHRGHRRGRGRRGRRPLHPVACGPARTTRRCPSCRI